MGDFAYRIDHILWLCCFLLLIVSIVYKLDISSRVALTIWVAGNLIMDKAQPFVMNLATLYGDTGASLWYVAWSAVDVFCVWCIYKIHAVHDVQVSKLTRYIMVCLLSLCALQFLRYADRAVFETNLLSEIYKYIIVSINISVVPFAIFWFIKDIQTLRKGVVL